MMVAMLAFRGTCGHDVQVPDEFAGRAVRCPYCHTVLHAPEAIPYAMPAHGSAPGLVPSAPPPGSPLGSPLGPPLGSPLGSPLGQPPPRGLVGVERRQSTPLKALYLVSLIAGVIAVAAIYLVFFDSLSEEELVRITPFWAFPIAFGFYGYVSQRLIRYLDEGKAASMYEAAKFVVDSAGKWSILVLLPFLALRWRSSLLVTLVASAVLAGFLWIFFSLIFPEL